MPVRLASPTHEWLDLPVRADGLVTRRHRCKWLNLTRTGTASALQQQRPPATHRPGAAGSTSRSRGSNSTGANASVARFGLTRRQPFYSYRCALRSHRPWCFGPERATLIARVFDGRAEGLTRDDVLDNITLYWLTNTAISSARLYWETKLAFFEVKNVAIPVAVSTFPDELYQAPRSWAERAFPQLIHYNRLGKGGRFAAWEQPEIFTEELRAAFRCPR